MLTHTKVLLPRVLGLHSSKLSSLRVVAELCGRMGAEDVQGPVFKTQNQTIKLTLCSRDANKTDETTRHTFRLTSKPFL